VPQSFDQMAPKRGSKRAAEVSVEAEHAKKLQTVLKQKGVTKATYEALVEAVEHPMASGLNPATRKMLVAMLPQGALVPVEERQEGQQACVRMLEEVFESITNAMTAEIAEADSQVSKETAEATKLEEDVKNAETALKEASEAVATKKTILADAAKTVIDSKTNLVEKEKDQQTGDAAYGAAVAEMEDVEAVLAQDFRLLRDGVGEGEAYDTSKILSLSTKLGLEDSLLTALPSVISKKPSERGSFDAMVVAQLEEGLRNKVSKLNEIVTTGAPAAEAREAATAEAKGAVDASKQAQQLAADELTEANNAQKQRAREAETVKASLVAQGPAVKDAAALKTEKDEQLQRFVEWNLASFEMLRDRETLAPKKTKIVEETPEEAKAMEAAEAGA